jgi:hypothetical protein
VRNWRHSAGRPNRSSLSGRRIRTRRHSAMAKPWCPSFVGREAHAGPST